jgi:hypothetical protein
MYLSVVAMYLSVVIMYLSVVAFFQTIEIQAITRTKKM